MTNIAQLTANRRNALQSTGPRTSEGKSAASRNARKHGVLSDDLIIKDEKRHDLETLRLGIYKSLSPEGVIEELFVEKIINAIWRIRRLTKVEGELFSKREFSYEPSCLSQAFRGSDGVGLQVLSRYEAALERNLYRALHELQRIQGMRMGYHVLAPMSIDITSDREGKIGFDS